MDIDSCTQHLATQVAAGGAFGSTLKFDCGEAGSVFIDGREDSLGVDRRVDAADCTVTISLDSLAALLKGELNPMAGFMAGKLRVDGDMGVAMKLLNFV